MEFSDSKNVVSVSQLSKCYGDHLALNDLNLEIHSREIYGLIGMSGSGKTTFMRCLTALERPSKGKIFIAGEPISELGKRSLRLARRKIGMIFQHFNLFSARTALENVFYPLELMGKSTAGAYELLKLVGLKGKENFYPAQLSGGEKQRVAIARALAGDPELLLCDEATSSLDPQSTHAVLELLSELNEKLGLTILLITHEMEVIRQVCTHVAVLEGGAVVEKGRTADLFAHPKHVITKRFLHFEVPPGFQPSSSDSLLLRLSFPGASAKQPLISQLIRKCQVEVNILLGGIDQLKEETIGNLLIELRGDLEQRGHALKFLKDHGVGCDELA